MLARPRLTCCARGQMQFLKPVVMAEGRRTNKLGLLIVAMDYGIPSSQQVAISI